MCNPVFVMLQEYFYEMFTIGKTFSFANTSVTLPTGVSTAVLLFPVRQLVTLTEPLSICLPVSAFTIRTDMVPVAP
jgi:hypothetical protein